MCASLYTMSWTEYVIAWKDFVLYNCSREENRTGAQGRSADSTKEARVRGKAEGAGRVMTSGSDNECIAEGAEATTEGDGVRKPAV